MMPPQMTDPLNAFIPHDEVLLPGAPEGAMSPAM